MKTHHARFTPACCRVAGRLVLLVLPAMLWADLPAGFLYVSTSGADSPAYGKGYTDLQTAINTSTNGCTVWVEDGFVCNAGGTFVTGGGVTNRILLDKAITLRSVSGTTANAAVIVGAHHNPAGGVINGTASVRCLYVSAAATVIGLQLTNGATAASSGYGGGGYLSSAGAGALFSNCVIIANNASARAGGIYGGTLTHCEITKNAAAAAGGYGGGLYGSTARHCRFTANSARVGGGAHDGTLSDCTIISNSCVWNGGGVINATLDRCLLAFNKSTGQDGGGAHSSTLRDCVLTGNSSHYNGAAIRSGSALRCVITNNANVRIGGGVIVNCAATQCLISNNTFLSAYNGGVVKGGSLVNCLLIGNKTTLSMAAATAYGAIICNSTVADNPQGKAAYTNTLINSIVWSNQSAGGSNFATNCCIAASALLSGKDNRDTNPRFVGTGDWPYRLDSDSPCIDRGIGGFSWMLPADPNTRGLDYSGRPRVIGSAVDMGAFEFMPDGSSLIIR